MTFSTPTDHGETLCECSRRKGKLTFSPSDGYEFHGGCIKDAICSMLQVLKHKHLRKKNRALQKGEEVKVYEAPF